MNRNTVRAIGQGIWRRRFRWLAPLLALAGLVAVAVALTGASIRADQERATAERWTTHTMQVLLTAEKVRVSLADIERGERGYILTNDRAFLDRAASDAIPQLLRQLQQQTSDNASQQGRVAEISEAAARQLDFYRGVIGLVESGRRDAAVATIATGRGRELMATTRGLLDQVSAQEDRLLAERRGKAREADSTARRSTYLLALFGGLVLLGAAAAALAAYRAAERAREADLREQADEKLRHSQQRFLSLIDATDAVAWHTDANGAFTEPLPSWERYTGQTFAEYQNGGWADALHPDERAEVVAAWSAAVASQQPFEFEHRLRRMDGEYRTMLVRAVPLRGLSGRVVEWVGLHTDISDRKLAEDELAAAKDAAEAANQAKSQFIANMSHELRTPLSSVIGYAELLEEEAEDLGPPGAAIKADLEKIEASARHLLSLINGVLDISKIEAGKMEIDAEDFDVRTMIEEVGSTVSGLVDKKGNRLLLELAPGLGTMHSDVVKLRQCLFNLVSNAAKFTEHGEIRLQVARDGDVVRFVVADSGIGMTGEQVEKLFERFTQADASTTRRFGGTGLGLAITKAFAEMLGGQIEVASTEGVGTTFTLSVAADVRIARKLAPEPTPEALEPGGEDAVLVIDDDPAQRDLLNRFLSREGFTVRSANDGEAGLRLARQLRPRAILLDVMMPRIDGWSVLRALKDDESTCDIPVIMVTMVDERALGYALGADDYITKPIDWTRLKRALARKHQAGEAGTALVVEHDGDVRGELRRILASEGWRVVEAVNRASALQAIGEAKPDVLVVDVQTPEENGLALITTLRDRPEWQDTPIIAVTGTMSGRELERLRHDMASLASLKGTPDPDQLIRELRRVAKRNAAAAAATVSEGA